MVAWDSPTRHSPSFRSLQHRDQSPTINEPPRVHTALALSPVQNSRHVPLKFQLQLRLCPVAPLKASDLYPSFPNPQHASAPAIPHQTPSSLLLPGCFVWDVQGVPRATHIPGTAGVLGSDLPGRIRARTRQCPGGVWGGGSPGCFLVGKSEETDFTASSLKQPGGSPRAASGCAIQLRVLAPEGAQLWDAVGPEWDLELMGTREGLSVPGEGVPE